MFRLFFLWKIIFRMGCRVGGEEEQSEEKTDRNRRNRMETGTQRPRGLPAGSADVRDLSAVPAAYHRFPGGLWHTSPVSGHAGARPVL